MIFIRLAELEKIISSSGSFFTEWLGLEGNLKLVLYLPPAMCRDTFHHSRFLQDLCNLALNTSRERDWKLQTGDKESLFLALDWFKN